MGVWLGEFWTTKGCVTRDVFYEQAVTMKMYRFPRGGVGAAPQPREDHAHVEHELALRVQVVLLPHDDLSHFHVFACIRPPKKTLFWPLGELSLSMNTFLKI